VIEAIADTEFEDMKDFYQRLEDKARKAMVDLAAPLTVTGKTVDQQITYGNRAREIVGYADQQGTDLIVLSSRQLDPEQPEKTWTYSLGYERRFADDGGSLELEVLYQDISDHIDKILIGTDDSGIGNIGSARRLNFNLDLTTRFGFIGAPTAVLTFSYTYDDNEVTDPFTGEKRRLKDSTPHYFRVNYRHDVENTNFAYGIVAHRRTYRERQDVSLYELSKLQAHLDHIFAEYNFTENVKMRFQAAHNLNRDARTFDKTFYIPCRGL